MEKDEQDKIVQKTLELFPNPRMKEVLLRVIKYLPLLRGDPVLLGSFKERVRDLVVEKMSKYKGRKVFEVKSETSLDLVAKMLAADIQIGALKKHCELWRKSFFVLAEEEGLPPNITVSLKIPELVIYSKYENEADKLLCIAEAARKVAMADMESVKCLAAGQIPESLSCLKEIPVKGNFYAELAAVCIENKYVVQGVFIGASPELSVNEPPNPLLFLGVLKKEVLKTLEAEEYKQEALPSVVRKILVFDAVADMCVNQPQAPEIIKMICGKVLAGEITEKQRALLYAIAMDPKEAVKWCGPSNMPEYFIACARVLSVGRDKELWD